MQLHAMSCSHEGVWKEAVDLGSRGIRYRDQNGNVLVSLHLVVLLEVAIDGGHSHLMCTIAPRTLRAVGGYTAFANLDD